MEYLLRLQVELLQLKVPVARRCAREDQPVTVHDGSGSHEVLAFLEAVVQLTVQAGVSSAICQRKRTRLKC